MSKTVYDLLLESPDASIPALQSAWRAAAAGDWLTVAKQLGYAAEDGTTAWHDECQVMADSFYAKAREVA